MNRSAPTPRRICADDRQPVTGDMLADAVRGLCAHPKRLPSKYFYDEPGSRLFERICEQPEYYLTRTELAIMRECIDAIAEAIGPDVRLVEYGSGAGVKTRFLLRHLATPSAYVPIEISGAALRAGTAALATDFPDVEMLPVCADFTRALELPRAARAPRRTAVYFPGSTIGNFDSGDALRLLRQMRAETGPDGGVLIGVDLVKDKAVLEAAYNDGAGVTAEFTLNLLVRLNREIGADFDISAFGHRARYHPLAGRIETHIVSRRAQDVHFGGRTFHFADGEAMLVEYSCKYTLGGFARLAARAGWRVAAAWTDPARQFSIQWLLAA